MFVFFKHAYHDKLGADTKQQGSNSYSFKHTDLKFNKIIIKIRIIKIIIKYLIEHIGRDIHLNFLC